MCDNSDKIKITLVGPINPYRGGVAQYNTQLNRALMNYADVNVVSFKRLYPKWLYPGKRSKGLASGVDKLGNIRYIIDTYSLFSLKKTANKIISDKTDVVLITWWTLFWQPGLAYIARRARKHNIKVVYICHNVFDHDSNVIVQKLSRFFLGQADGYLIHATEQAKILRSNFSKAKIIQRLLPIFNHYPPAKNILKKRGRLELLYFGFIRPYKGLDTLIEALTLLNDQELYITIAGEVWLDRNQLEQDIKSKKISGLEMHFNYVSDAQAAEYFARADVIVLPYKSATGSAVAALAYNYGKPILGTRVGGLNDAVVEGKTGWLVAPNSPEDLANAIKGINRQKAKSTRKSIHKLCEENSWDAMSKSIIKFCRDL